MVSQLICTQATLTPWTMDRVGVGIQRVQSDGMGVCMLYAVYMFTRYVQMRFSVVVHNLAIRAYDDGGIVDR